MLDSLNSIYHYNYAHHTITITITIIFTSNLIDEGRPSATW